jgi:hypothetical protein
MRTFASVLTALIVTTAVVLVTSPADAAARYVVTATANADNLDVGHSFTVTGKVTPRARGQRVKVQRLVGGHWTTIARPRLNRHSHYRATVVVAAPGNNRYRVVKPRSNGHRRGVSPTITVVGWRWRPLTAMPVSGLSFHAAQLASGQLGPAPYSTIYRPFVKLGDPASSSGSISYRLDGNCVAFDATVGVTPDSSAGPLLQENAYVFVVPAGGSSTQIAKQWLYMGQDPGRIVRTGSVISTASVIELSTDVGGGSYVGWGDPEVYCRS